MNGSKPEEIRFGAMVVASKYEYDQNPARWEHYAESYLREALAQHIQRVKFEETKTDNMVEKRIDLYVADADTFWMLVRKEAEKIAIQFMPR